VRPNTAAAKGTAMAKTRPVLRLPAPEKFKQYQKGPQISCVNISDSAVFVSICPIAKGSLNPHNVVMGLLLTTFFED
jgi:hypothetical protein